MNDDFKKAKIMPFPRYVGKKHRQIVEENKAEGQPIRKNPKLEEETANQALDRFLQIPVLVMSLTEFLPLRDQFSLLQTTRQWREAISISLAHLKTISSYDLFLALNWPGDKLTKALGRRKIFSQQIHWLMEKSPNVAEMRDLTWCLRGKDHLLQKHLQDIRTFKYLKSLHITSGTVLQAHLCQFLSVIGSQLEFLFLKCHLKYKPDKDPPQPSFSFLKKLKVLVTNSEFLPLVKDVPHPELLEVFRCSLTTGASNDKYFKISNLAIESSPPPTVDLLPIWVQILINYRNVKELEMWLTPGMVMDDFWDHWEPKMSNLVHLKSLTTSIKSTQHIGRLFSKFPNLTQLNVVYTKVANLMAGLHTIVQLCPKLVSIKVRELDLGGSGFFLPKAMDLQEFQMVLTLKSCWYWGHLTSFSNLRVLDLRNCEINCHAPAKKGFYHFPLLKQLKLNNVRIWGVELDEFTKLLVTGLSNTCHTLSLEVEVGLHGNRLRDTDWTAILSAKGAQFRMLGIGKSVITGLTLNRICVNCKALERLELRQSPLQTKKGAKETDLLHKCLPKLIVVVDGEDVRADGTLERPDEL